MKNSKFKNIRAYRVGWLLPLVDFLVLYPILLIMKRKTTHSIQLEYCGDKQRIEQDIRHGAFFMTNHRDICMDNAWLTYLLRTRYFIHPYFGIGNNLFGKWWIEHVVRFLRGFVVIRNGGFRDQRENAITLSEYIRHLRKRHKSIWLAQREGRAKDGNDVTQPGVLKMLTFEAKDFFESIKELNICPVSISYEFDPCDYLKEKELQQKRDNPEWKKSPMDDLINMKAGMFGYKGGIHYHVAACINDEIDAIDRSLGKNEKTAAVARIIDKHIHKNYKFWPINYYFYELLTGDTRFADKYTADEKAKLDAYLQGQIAKVDLPNRDDEFCRTKILEMYANPVINYLKATEE